MVLHKMYFVFDTFLIGFMKNQLRRHLSGKMQNKWEKKMEFVPKLGFMKNQLCRQLDGQNADFV